jgi:site-specific recombinase XerD
MNTAELKNQLILGEDYILVWVEQFLKAKKSENKARGTIKYYRDNLKTFTDFLDSQEVKLISQITPNVIRDFLLLLEERGHNAGGIHGFYRAVKAFLKWYWEEEETTTHNPILKVKPPKVPVESIEGVSIEQFHKLLNECGNDFLGERNKAILKVLLDTGIRADELCHIKLEDLNLIDCSILIQKGKGGKPRFVFFGKSTKRQIRVYLRFRGIEGTYLFINRSRERLVYFALRQVVRRLGEKANLTGIGLHDFRRAFCLECLKKGIPEITIARLMGHSNTQLIGRYAKQTTVDLMNSYKSIVDD